MIATGGLYLYKIEIIPPTTSVTLTSTTALTNLPLSGSISLKANVNAAVTEESEKDDSGAYGASFGLYKSSEYSSQDRKDYVTEYGITDDVLSLKYSGLEYGTDYVLEIWKNSLKGKDDSSLRNATQTFSYTTLPLAAPTFSAPAGDVVSGTVVTCTSATSGAGITVRYTTDGTAPTSSSPAFPAAGVAVTEATTFKAATFYENGTISQMSEVVTAAYTIAKGDLTFSFNTDDEFMGDAIEKNSRTVSYGSLKGTTLEYHSDATWLRLKLNLSALYENLGTAESGSLFTVTSSNSEVISVAADDMAIYGTGTAAAPRAYLWVKVKGTGTTTISVKFNGSDKYNASEAVTKEFTIVDAVAVNSISYPETSTVEISTGADDEKGVWPLLTLKVGQSGMLDLVVDPASEKDKVLEDAVYTWKRLTKNNSSDSYSSKDVISLSSTDGVVTANKVGRALVTATYTPAVGDTKTASYVVLVQEEGTDPDFKYGPSITFDYYDGATYRNPVIKGSVESWTVSSSKDGTYGESVSNIVEKIDAEGTKVDKIDVGGRLHLLGSGEVWVKATLSGGDAIVYKLTVVKNAQKYVVKKGLTPVPGDEVTTVPGIKMTFGGYTSDYGKGTSHNYTRPGTGEAMEDTYGAAGTDESGLDPENYYFVGINSQDPRYEHKDADGNLRGWERVRVNTGYLWKAVPVYGAFFKFEPEVDGNLTVSVLQSGSIQDLSVDNRNKLDWWHLGLSGGVINKWNYKALYLTDERGLSVRAVNPYSKSKYAHPYEKPASTTENPVYEKDGTTELTTQYREQLSLKHYIDGQPLADDGETLTGTAYAYAFTYGKTTNNDGVEIPEETVAGTKIKKELAVALGCDGDEPTEAEYTENLTTDNIQVIMENENHGYWTLTQSNSFYTFPVKAGKTYFLFTDGAKLSLGSFEFEPARNGETELTIDGADKQTTKTFEESATETEELNNCTVTLERKLTANQPNSLMLPFSMSVSKVEEVFGEGTKVLHVDSIGNNIQFVRHHYPMIVAGEPCIVYPTRTASSWTIPGVTVENKKLLDRYVPVSGGGYRFDGCFYKKTMPAGSYYVSALPATEKTTNGQDVYIYRVPTADWMSNTRAFFCNTSGNTSAKLAGASFVEAIDEQGVGGGFDEPETTFIALSQGGDGAAVAPKEGVYSMSGQKLSGEGLPKGVYIVNGRKVVVK